MNSEFSPSDPLPLQDSVPPLEATRLRPIPLEDPELTMGYWMRFWQTLRLAFTRPMEFFQRIPQGDSVGAPLGFSLLLSAPFYLFLCIYPAMFGLMALITHFSGPAQSAQEPPFHWMSLGCLGGILLLPLLQILGMLFWGLIQHLFLRIWGVHAPEIPIEQDSRACVYVHGFLMLSFLTPIGPIAALAVVVIAGLGFARMHRAPAWRGVAATLTPALLVPIGLILAPLLLVVSSHSKSPTTSKLPPSVGPIPVVEKSMSPDEVTMVHVDQARIFLNDISHEKLSSQEAITALLKLPPFTYPTATNPYGGHENPFRRGLPQVIGEVGLIPIRENDSANTRSRSQPGVLIIGKKKDGEIRRIIQL